MALLMVRVYPNTINLVGRWQSYMIMCYLHITSKSFIEGLAVNIFQFGTYTLIPTVRAGN